MEAAELYSVTELEAYFDQLADLGETEQRLAEHLRRLRRSHDLDTILKTVQEVQHA